MKDSPYLVIARKYRPQTFEDVLDQHAAATTLKNAITAKRIGHAYLFTGPRGVGKTSMARIFAKALNCETGPTVSPCGKCDSCLEIENSRSLDVLEIDGASNRGIDEIRALRENVKFAPAKGKYKVYIIDEVHQITTDGFNALLKTLEEPPAHVKFIFATTSAEKVPATILSRCQRFDFRRLESARIAEALKVICKKEKIKAEDEALFAIARAADGSMRDAQSILDQVASMSQSEIRKADVTESLGALQDESLVALTDAVAEQDAANALTLLDKLIQEGKEPALLVERLMEHVRNLSYLKISDSLGALLDVADTHLKELKKQKERFSKEELFYFFSVLIQTQQNIKRFEQKRIPVEMMLIKICHRSSFKNLDEALAFIKTQKFSAPSEPAQKKISVEPIKSAREVSEPTPPNLSRPIAPKEDEDEDIAEIEELPTEDLPVRTVPQGTVSLEGFMSLWDTLIRSVKSEKMSLAMYLSEGQPTEVSGQTVRIAFPEIYNFHRECLEVPENKRLIEKHLAALSRDGIQLEFYTSKDLKPEMANGKSPEHEVRAPEAPPSEQSQAALKSAMNILGGKIIPAA